MREVKAPERKRNVFTRVGELMDWAVYAISPLAGSRRMQVRRAMDQAFLSTYEGARIDSTRGSSWIGSQLSSDSALEADLPSLRKRSRELYQNDAIGGAIDNRVNHVVGTGFTPQSRVPKEIDAKGSIAAQIEAVVERWALACDVSGNRSLWQLERLSERHWCADGESFTVLSDVPGRELPLAIEVIDPERVETPPQHLANPRVRMGIETDENKRIVAYWIRKTVPGDTKEFNYEYDRVDAWRVLHLYEAWFAQQSRGLPWMARTLLKLKDAKDLDEAAIIAAQVEACYAAFVSSPMSAALNAAGAANETVNNRRMEDIAPGTIRYLDPGEEITFGTPGGTSTYAPIQEWNYRRVAAAMNYPYEMLVKNWSGTSFAGGRLVLTDARLDCEFRQKMHVERWLSPIWRRIVDEAVMVGAIDEITPSEYFDNQEVYQKHSWTPPAWQYAITPGEELNALVNAVNENLMTKADAIASRGGDLEHVFKQRQIERKAERDMDIVPPDVEQVEAQAQAATSPQKFKQQSEQNA